MTFPRAIQTVVIFALTASVSVPAFACSAADPGTRMGRVLSVNKGAGTLTLLDAETTRPVTLFADAALLDKIGPLLYHSTSAGSIAVTYEKDGDTLRALEFK